MTETTDTPKDFRELLLPLMPALYALNSHTTIARLYRDAVTAGRDLLHLERCGIVTIDENQTLSGTWGMDFERNIVDEHHIPHLIHPDILKQLQSDFRPLYHVIPEAEHYSLVNGEHKALGRGWVACTPIHSSDQKIIGLLFNDCAISGAPMNPEQQTVAALFCAYIGGIADRLKTEEALIDSETRLHDTESLYKNLIRQLPAITYVVELSHPRAETAKHKTVYISPQIKDVFGYSQEEWLRDKDLWLRLIHPDDRDRVLSEILQANTECKNFRLEYRTHTRSGEERWIHNQALYPDDALDRKTVRIQGCMFDITKEKKAHQDQQKLLRKLAQAERMESIGLLAGSVAHDLNNILGPVVGYPDLLLDEIPAGRTRMRNDLEAVRDSARKAADVIQDLLNLARRENYELTVIDLNQQARVFLESPGFESMLLNHPKVRIRMNIPREPLYIEASIPHLNKLLMNLIINGSEAMSGGGQITVSTSIQLKQEHSGNLEPIEPGEYACLSVRDEGSGIDTDQITQIFEPFYTTKNLGRSGTGLGLSVVYGVVKDFYGYIDVESGDSRGTTFSIYIPISNRKPEQPEEEPAKGPGGARVLVIDDQPEQRTLAERLLARLGYDAEVAIHGHDALEYFKQGKRPDVLMLDMIMEEGFDGLDTYREILELAPGQKCLIVSGYAANERVQEAIDLGASMYISKPVSLQKLDLALRKVLYGSQVRA